MIEAFRDDDIINKVGGRFKLSMLIQRRWLQLMQGARPMVDDKGLTPMQVVVNEIVEGHIELEEPIETETEDDLEA